MTAVRIYQYLSGARIAGNTIVGVWCIVDPAGFSALQGAAWATPMLLWARAWGATLLSLMVCYVPGLFDPIDRRVINWISIAVPFWMAAIWTWAGPGYERFAAWDFTWGITLLIAYSAALRSAR